MKLMKLLSSSAAHYSWSNGVIGMNLVFRVGSPRTILAYTISFETFGQVFKTALLVTLTNLRLINDYGRIHILIT